MLTNIWLQALAAIAVPALLIAAVPRRWVKRAMLLWLVSPLIAYAGIIAATGSNAAQDEGYAFPPVAPTAPIGVSKTAEALIAAG